MNNLYLKKPNLEELDYRKQLMEDPLTMDYNSGWEVNYDGYDYDTGTISFPKSKWESWYNNQSKDSYYAYIIRKQDKHKIGAVNYHYNKNNKRYECGIVIEGRHRGNGYAKEALKLLCDEAFNNGVNKLYDNFEETREIASKIFFELGFKIVKKEKYIRFKKEVNGYLICLERGDYIDR